MTQPDGRRELETDGPADDALVREFVEHWGVMARAWGINASMGELFALLYISGGDWTAEDLRARLDVSRGNVSMNLRELLNWGVVRRFHRPGERRELYRAEADVWTLFRRIVGERKRRELDPTLLVLDRLSGVAGDGPTQSERKGRLASLREFLVTLDAFATRLMEMEPEEAAEIGRLLAGSTDPGEP